MLSGPSWLALFRRVQSHFAPRARSASSFDSGRRVERQIRHVLCASGHLIAVWACGLATCLANGTADGGGPIGVTRFAHTPTLVVNADPRVCEPMQAEIRREFLDTPFQEGVAAQGASIGDALHGFEMPDEAELFTNRFGETTINRVDVSIDGEPATVLELYQFAGDRFPGTREWWAFSDQSVLDQWLEQATNSAKTVAGGSDGQEELNLFKKLKSQAVVFGADRQGTILRTSGRYYVYQEDRHCRPLAVCVLSPGVLDPHASYHPIGAKVGVPWRVDAAY
jgi:hypothetical protein